MALAPRHRIVVTLAGFLASIGFLWLAARRLDFSALEQALVTIEFWPWLPLAVASYVAGHIARGVRCRLLLRHEADLHVVTATSVVVVGYAANNVLPARMGELVRAGMLTERTGIPIIQAVTITLIERILDGLAILGLLLLGLGSGAAPEWSREIARVGLTIFGIAFVAMMLAVQTPGLLIASVSRVSSRLGQRWHDRLVRLTSSIVSAGACFRNPQTAALLALYSAIIWVLEAGMFVALLPAFGLAPEVSVGAVAMSVTNLGLLVPSTPGFIGPFHYFCSRALVAQGVPEAVGLAYATVVHLAFFIPVTLWGALAMLWYGVELGATATVARVARGAQLSTERDGLLLHEVGRLEARTSPTVASHFIHSLVEALVSSPGEALATPALERSAGFVHGQLQALPKRLTWMLDTGLATFRLVTRVRFLRAYCELPVDTRRSWTLLWSDGRYAILRKLFKPVRATALLAYHEQASERVPTSMIRLQVRADDSSGSSRNLARRTGQG